jgi:prepilin signal peptidase PulO-like enzyme (type II secretory pathway)
VTLQAAEWTFAGALSAVCGAIDARTGKIPNRLTYPALALLLLLGWAAGRTAETLEGSAAAAGALLALHLVTRGRGIGLGDAKLAGCIGAALGPRGGLFALGCAFVAGGAVAGFMLASGRAERGDRIAFGPYLALGALASIAGSR